MLGESAEDSFQIVVDGFRTRQIYPSIKEASPHVAHSPCADRTKVASVCFGQSVATHDVVMSCSHGVPVSVRWTKVGASGGLGEASCRTVDGVVASGKWNLLWNEATMVASSRHVLERPLLKEATMTAPADVEGCESELSHSVQCWKGFLGVPD